VNYYEELGLTPEASDEDVQRAYRNLTRLVHPDHQVDEELRRLAESQMKRLNTIHDVLTDPVQRQKYDQSLAEDAGGSNRFVPIIVTPAREHSRKLPSWLGSGRGVWVLTALIGVGALCWYFLNPPVQYPGPESPRESKPAVAKPSGPMPSPAPKPARGPREQMTPSKEMTELRRQLRAALAERDAARAQLAALKATEPVNLSQPEVAGP
jgi:curved DNA-binding protein CbpA